MQTIALAKAESRFEYWGQPPALERLLRRYFEIAAQSVAPLVSIHWENGGPVIRLRWSGLPLIIMGRPTLQIDAGRRAIGVPVLGGVLSRTTPGATLSIILTHQSPEICAIIDLEGYGPRGNHVAIVRVLCRHVQCWLHVRVGRRFLRELAERWEMC